MADPSPVQRRGERVEPTSLTLADLSMLVVGIALVLALPWVWPMEVTITIAGWVVPRWGNGVFVAQEAAGKGALIFVPAIMARGFRWGGWPRPAEWLAILAGLSSLERVLQILQLNRRFARWFLVDLPPWLGWPVPPLLHEPYPGRGIQIGDTVHYGYDGFPVGFRFGSEGRIWGGFALILVVGLVGVLAIGRKRLPTGIKTVLLGAAAFAWLVGGDDWLRQGCLDGLAVVGRRGAWPKGLTDAIALGLATVPTGLLFGIPLMATLRDIRGALEWRWSWTEWGSAFTGLVALAIGTGITLGGDLIQQAGDPTAWPWLIVELVRLTFVGWLSAMVVGSGRLGTSA